MATAIISALQEWDVDDRVKAMCFNTTASNTRYRTGAYILLEQKLGGQRLHLACRHHDWKNVLCMVSSKWNNELHE